MLRAPRERIAALSGSSGSDHTGPSCGSSGDEGFEGDDEDRALYCYDACSCYGADHLNAT